MLCECGFDSTTSVVSCDNDVFDFQHFDSILNDCQAIDVGGRSLIGNVSMDENLSWLKSYDFIGWNS